MQTFMFISGNMVIKYNHNVTSISSSSSSPSSSDGSTERGIFNLFSGLSNITASASSMARRITGLPLKNTPPVLASLLSEPATQNG